MDIAALSTILAQSNLSNQVGISLLSMGKDMMEQQGLQLQKLMESSNASAIERSINPQLGGNIDLKL